MSAQPGNEPVKPDQATVTSMLAAIGAAKAAQGNELDRLPKRMSPSSAKLYIQCPQAYWFKTIAGISTPSSVAAARGTIAHSAFERVFDHPAGDRTPELAISYIEPAWQEMVNPTFTSRQGPGTKARARAQARADDYRALAEPGSDTEREMLEYAAMCVRNWFEMERVDRIEPTEIVMPNGEVIDGRELAIGATTFGMYLHGFIDRVDKWHAGDGTPRYAISDYKTGRPFHATARWNEYAQSMRDKIRWESFFQLRVYALLAWEVYQVPVNMLRLVYVATGDRETGIATMPVTRQVIERTRAEVRATWNAMQNSARTNRWPTKTGPLCAWCYYQDTCPSYGNTMPVVVDGDEVPLPAAAS